MSEISLKEHRASRRIKTIKIDTIISQKGNCTMPCTVADISASGVQIKPVDAMSVPESFQLVVTPDQTYECDLVRRVSNRIAVPFS